MRRNLHVIILSLGVALAWVATAAIAAPDEDDPPARDVSFRVSRAHRATLGVSSQSPETTYVGFTPGHSADNYWSIWAGTSATGTYHRPPARGGMWDFEPSYADVHGDTLQGWWPYRMTMSGTGGLVIPDDQRPWRCLDFGNNANYSGSFGAGPDGRKRTFGVIGVWHVDGGNTIAVPASVNYTNPTYGVDPVLGVGGVNWAPLVGAASAWMGLRRHGDNSHVDPITENPFNEDAMVYQGFTAVSTGGTDKKFPGYGTQMDQILYRDIDLSAAGDTSLTVSFAYRTAMATSFSTSSITRSGWFVHDPLRVATGGANPNFISNNPSNPTPPADSFMVYVGTPAESAVVLSDGQMHTIYDPQRRWFGEVLRSNEGLYRDIASIGGTTSGTALVTLSAATLAPLKAAGGNRVRLAFRVKTNQTFDDQDRVSATYSSGGVGAAIVDDVRIAKGVGPPTVIGAFESPSEIDNNPDVSALDAWKSTGKPPQTYHHSHEFADLEYLDVCGAPGSATRVCNMTGVVISMGDHDRNEETGHSDIAAEMEPFDGIISPTIQICGPYDGPGGTNRMGLTADQAVATDDYYVDYEIYTGAFDFFNQGNAYIPALQTYPAANGPNGLEYKRWGEIRYPGAIFFNPIKECYRSLTGAKTFGLIRTSNASGIPDSVRLILRRRQECYRFNITNCVTNDGGYWDNISLAIVDGGDPLQISVDLWHWLQDTFPFNETPGITASAASFDTTTALIKTGFNIAPFTGNTSRFDVPGDTSVVIAIGSAVRIDLVFRILPGPGNYVDPISGVQSQLRAVPNALGPIPAPTLGVANFWSNYLYDNGDRGSPGGHPIATSGPLAGQKIWSPHVWNSARCDTAEVNVFNLQGRFVVTGAPGSFMSAYHEDELNDPHRGALGIPRNICFVADSTPGSASSTREVICGSGAVPSGVSYPPAWTQAPGSGLPASCTAAGCVTKEGTKIIPDGLLTPGSHIQYFFRREDDGSPGFSMCPDTDVVTPQESEQSIDGHRWQQFSVLPDRWKSGGLHPVLRILGSGPACMLVIDEADRRGNESAWDGVANALELTSAIKYGAHNGVATPLIGDPNDPAFFVRRHLGQPGTNWDLYNVKAGETLNAGSGSIGSRYAWHDSTNIQIDGKRSRQGPSQEMLAQYKMVVLLTANLNSSILGPYGNRSQNDYGVLENWLASGHPWIWNRGILVQDDGIVESNDTSAKGFVLNTDYLGVDLRSQWYQELSGNSASSIDVRMTSALSPRGDVLGLSSTCSADHDVLNRSGTLAAETADAAYYEGEGVGSPFIASVLKRPSSDHPWIALTSGWDLANTTSPASTSPRGRLVFMYNVINSAFGVVCPIFGETWDWPLSVEDAETKEFMSLAGNPARGAARVHFGLVKSGRVEVRIYDVAGRLVREIANRNFTPGEHTLTWDGLDADGQRAANGVYFTRIRRAGGMEDVKKLVMLAR